MAKQATAEQPIMRFGDQAAWREWLHVHHADSNGIWLQIAKKGADQSSVSYLEALDEALCYGWIDGQKKSFDDQSFLQKFTPRRARSMWSKVNRDKVEALINNGKMHPAGQAEIDRAKADGRWEAAYDPPSKAQVPDDLQAELDRNPAAAAFFATLNSTNRFAILFRLQQIKTAATRAKRLAEFVRMLENGEKLYP